MPADKVLPVKLAKCMVIRCRFHQKEARYRVKFFEDDMLVVVECIACMPVTEICRFAVDRTRKP